MGRADWADRACRFAHLHRQENWHVRRNQDPFAGLPSPGEHEAFTDTVSRRDLAYTRPRFVRLTYNLELLLDTPSTPALPAGDDLDHPIHRHSFTDTLTTALRCQPGRN